MNSIDTGRFIRIQRKKLNLSQSKLAEMLCVEPQTVSKWERGLGMPDYDNVDKLREIFNCTLSEILEPNFDEPEEAKTEEFTEEKETITNLPVLVEMIDSSEGSTTDGKKFSIFDFLNKKKLKEIIEKVFGYEYANTYNEKFLFKDVRKKRSKEEYENTITQGMFKNKTSHSVIGIEAPWLYLRVLFFMLMCTGIAAVASLFGITMPFVIIGSLCSVLPLMIFLFESNFARNLSIIDVLKMFAIGGLGSICLVAITSIMYEAIDETIVTVVFAPLLEEICKASNITLTRSEWYEIYRAAGHSLP
jgi:transcriptional regulator with XRE-family HTH domain